MCKAKAMSFDFSNKTVLVTGGSRGIGRAIAEHFYRHGANVVISSRKADALSEVVKEVSASEGGAIDYIAANVGVETEAYRVVDETIARFGSVDVLVNNAATNPYYGPMIDIDASRAQKILDVNLLGVLWFTQAAFKRYMKESENTSSVINIASIGGLSVESGIGFYNVSKAAVIHMTKQLANDLGPKVRVNAIAPGLVRTDFAKALWENHEASVAARLPMKRIGEPDDIAGAALFLGSDLSRWITGETMVVDGGAMVTP
jgi:NAD(P)-dependent dehydrogenase (short-subunit alcohol dehydrogenase family)